jgi:two-component system cell cycle sensor histidine kinase/response regulator CckA
MTDVNKSREALNAEIEELRRQVGQSQAEGARPAGDLGDARPTFQALADLLDLGIFVATLDGRLLYANTAAVRMAGFESCTDFAAQPTPMRYAEPGAREAFVAALEQHGRVRGFETISVRKDGSRYPIALSAIMVRGGQDGVPTLLGVVEDISVRKQAEQERERLQGQLVQAQKMESIGRLAGGVAHDFNNLLGAVLGHVDLALERLGPAGKVREDLLEVRKATRRSADLTAQLLAFARRQPVAPKVLEMNPVVAPMLKMLEPLIGENIVLEWQPAPQVLVTKIDPTQLGQILTNLCLNARDAIDGVGRVVIGTALSTFDAASQRCEHGPGRFVTLSVTDNGRGMSQEVVAHLFEPFFTTKGLGEGTGLGLATIYGIVKQNGGFIEVESAPGAGSTFRVHLPEHWGAADALPGPTPAPAAIKRGGETVLVVEDNPGILRVCTRMLEHDGYRVLAANRPSEGLRIADEQAGAIDLIIADVVMPEMNGRDLVARLRERNPQARHLFMSGYSDEIIAHHGILEEGLPFIQKPFTREDLAQKVREILDGT